MDWSKFNCLTNNNNDESFDHLLKLKITSQNINDIIMLSLRYRDVSATHLFNVLLEETQAETLMQFDLAIVPELLDTAMLAKHLRRW